MHFYCFFSCAIFYCFFSCDLHLFWMYLRYFLNTWYIWCIVSIPPFFWIHVLLIEFLLHISWFVNRFKIFITNWANWVANHTCWQKAYQPIDTHLVVETYLKKIWLGFKFCPFKCIWSLESLCKCYKYYHKYNILKTMLTVKTTLKASFILWDCKEKNNVNPSSQGS